MSGSRPSYATPFPRYRPRVDADEPAGSALDISPMCGDSESQQLSFAEGFKSLSKPRPGPVVVLAGGFVRRFAEFASNFGERKPVRIAQADDESLLGREPAHGAFESSQFLVHGH